MKNLRDLIFTAIFLGFTFFGCSPKFDYYIGTKSNTNNLFPFSDLDEIETYSFNRDSVRIRFLEKKIDSLSTLLTNEITKNELERRKEINYFITQRDEREASIIDPSTKLFAKTSEKIRTLSKNEFQTLRKTIVDSKPSELQYAECIPYYRDGIVFRKNKKIVGWINLCFSCGQINTFPKTEIYLTPDQWEKLWHLFYNWKHPIPIRK